SSSSASIAAAAAAATTRLACHVLFPATADNRLWAAQPRMTPTGTAKIRLAMTVGDVRPVTIGVRPGVNNRIMVVAVDAKTYFAVRLRRQYRPASNPRAVATIIAG